jgi:hypothetical protein
MEKSDFERETKRIGLRVWADVVSRCFPSWTKLLQSDGELYYYTTLDALVNGILNSENGVCLWASRCSHLNDPEEMNVGLSEFEILGELDWARNSVKNVMNCNHSISFSEYKDYLPMWKMYGDGGNGVMLVFGTQELMKKWHGMLQPCMYKGTKEYNTSIESISNLQGNTELTKLTTIQKQIIMTKMIQMFVLVTKNDDYLYEKEVRITGLGNPQFQQECEQKYRVTNNTIIPYVEAIMPKESLKGVCLGPLVKSELNQNTLKEFLRDKGFDNVEVSVSNINYR